MGDSNEFDLVRRCQSEDPDVYELAFRDLYERYQERVFNTAYRLVGNASDAADVSQEVFLTIFRKVGEFRFSSRFFTWLYRITVNLSIDRKRRRNASPRQFGESGGTGRAISMVSVIEDEKAPRPDAWADTEFVEVKVQRSIDHLSPKLRATVVLRYIEGLAYSEIAEVMSCSVGTVKSRLNRAHHNLELFLKPVVDELTAGGEE